MSDKPTVEMILSQDMVDAIKEAMHYYWSGSDCFSVSVGPWEIKYDENMKSASDAKESEVK